MRLSLPSWPMRGSRPLRAGAAGSTRQDNIDRFYAAGITVGCSRDPLRFCPRNLTTRAQMATFLDHRPQPCRPPVTRHRRPVRRGPFSAGVPGR